MIISVIITGYQPPQPVAEGTSVANASEQNPVATPNAIMPSVDDLVATDVAASLAEQINMPVSNYVKNMSQTLSVSSKLSQLNDSAIVKPQIVQPLVSSRGITAYTVEKGDTLASIASNFGLTVQTIQWANNMTGTGVSTGKKLTIPPIDGVIYTVKSSDTIAKLASTYQASKERITSFNNLEISGLKPGAKIVIPNGVLPSTLRPGYVAPVVQPNYIPAYGAGFGGSSWRVKIGTPGYAGNGYAYGNCTRYAFDRRVELGLRVGCDWGNAATWDDYARNTRNSRGESVYLVSHTPTVGAIMQNDGGYGHVAIVEKVKPNGDIIISEMNAYVAGGGWNIVSGRTIPASQTGYYNYIR